MFKVLFVFFLHIDWWSCQANSETPKQSKAWIWELCYFIFCWGILSFLFFHWCHQFIWHKDTVPLANCFLYLSPPSEGHWPLFPPAEGLESPCVHHFYKVSFLSFFLVVFLIDFSGLLGAVYKWCHQFWGYHVSLGHFSLFSVTRRYRSDVC